MKLTRMIGLLTALALVLAACSSGDPAPSSTTQPAPTTTQATQPPSGDTTTTPPGGSTNPLEAYGEDPTAADMDLVAKALGPVTPSDEASWNIILASIARADQDLDQATIDKAMECWSNPSCETGTGGEHVMGYADGGGHVNIWRGVSHMEAILQALTYPEIGKIISTEAFWDPATAAEHIGFLVNEGATFIAGYPDAGTELATAIEAAAAAGVPYISFSAGWVGLPGDPDALVPGQDYISVVGEDLCALGESFAEVIAENAPANSSVGVLGGSPGNALSVGWQQCHVPELEADGFTVLGPEDTFWVNEAALAAVQGFLTQDPDMAAVSYEYADGFHTALQAWDAAQLDLSPFVAVMRTDEQTLFCDWAERNDPDYQVWFSAGGNFQARTMVTAAMMHFKGAEIPGEIVVPHVMRKVTADDCWEDRPNDTVSGTSLVPDAVLIAMYSSN